MSRLSRFVFRELEHNKLSFIGKKLKQEKECANIFAQCKQFSTFQTWKSQQNEQNWDEKFRFLRQISASDLMLLLFSLKIQIKSMLEYANGDFLEKWWYLSIAFFRWTQAAVMSKWFIKQVFILPIFSDDRLSLAEFTLICRALFRNNKGHIYLIPASHLEEMFAVFDKNQDGRFLEKVSCPHRILENTPFWHGLAKR